MTDNQKTVKHFWDLEPRILEIFKAVCKRAKGAERLRQSGRDLTWSTYDLLEDVLQRALKRFSEQYPDFPTGMPEDELEENIAKIAKGLRFDWARHKIRHAPPGVPLNETIAVPANLSDPADFLDRAIRRLVRELLASPKPRAHRLAQHLILWIVLGVNDTKTIAALLGVTERTVRTDRAVLRSLLDERLNGAQQHTVAEAGR